MADNARPEIPAPLRQQAFKHSVDALFTIAADGSVQHVTLLNSTGNAEMDQECLLTLRRWHWISALRDGEPVASTVTQRIMFVVQ